MQLSGRSDPASPRDSNIIRCTVASAFSLSTTAPPPGSRSAAARLSCSSPLGSGCITPQVLVEKFHSGLSSVSKPAASAATLAAVAAAASAAAAAAAAASAAAGSYRARPSEHMKEVPQATTSEQQPSLTTQPTDLPKPPGAQLTTGARGERTVPCPRRWLVPCRLPPSFSPATSSARHVKAPTKIG